MSLINPLILYGLALAGVPVILHLMMRSKPRKMVFPALRLLQIRRKTNVRRMRLRHIWLLLLRMAVIALLVMAIARPSLPAADYLPNWSETLALLAIALVCVFVYFGVRFYWRRQQMSNHQLAYRTSILRAATGVLALLLFALLFVWPYQRRVAAEITGPPPDVAQKVQVAAVFLFDTSLSMDYRLESKTRLDVAKKIASDHMARLPSGSRVAVADTSDNSPVFFQADLAASQGRIESLVTAPISLPLNERLRSAVELQDDERRRGRENQVSIPVEQRKDRFIREVYIFTDLAKNAWRTEGSKFLREKLAEFDWLHLYIIDVSVLEPENVGIELLQLSRQTLPTGGGLIVTASLLATGIEDETHSVELRIADRTGKLIKWGQKTVEVLSGSKVSVQFELEGLTGPVVQGDVRLTSRDSLRFDDTRRFTVSVIPPGEILIVSDSKDEAIYLRTALAPDGLVRLKKARYHCTFLPTSKLAEANLDDYEVVCMVNVRHPSREAWDRLARYVDAGGGLAIFLGMPNTVVNPVAVDYNQSVAQTFLPAELLADVAFKPAETLDLQNLSHPILKKLGTFGNEGLAILNNVDIRRYWRVKPADDASVIAEYTDSRHSPALVERVHGKGRTILLTTSVDLPGWNDLPRAWVWPFLTLSDQMMHYLSQRSDNVFNYTAGEGVVLSLGGGRSESTYLLRKPAGQQVPLQVEPEARLITIDDADQMGHYQLISRSESVPFSIGFSVNSPLGESDFTRVMAGELDNLLGEDRYSIARDSKDLKGKITEGRYGIEAFPLIVFLMVFVFCIEHLVANKFYDSEQAAEHA